MKAVISGATRGIGKAIATELASNGFDLLLLARDEENLIKLTKELKTKDSNHEYRSIDLADLSQIEKLEISSQPIALLINNLGEYKLDEPSQINQQELNKLLEINLFSSINLTKKILPNLQINPHSTIINIGSVMSLKAEKEAISYSISKHAFKAWNDGLREELRMKGIKVTCIYPGAVNTSSWDGIKVNRKKMIQAEEIAKIVSTLSMLGDSTLVEEIRISPLNF